MQQINIKVKGYIIRFQNIISRVLMPLSIILLIASFFTWLQIFFFLLFIVIAYLNHILIKNKGYATIIPQLFYPLLFKRSLYDILCDIYFIKRISKIIKAILSPILTGVPPSMAHTHFQELQPQVQQAIFKKGIVNIVPQFSNHLLPADQYLRQQFLNKYSIKLNKKDYKWDKSQQFYKSQLQKLKRKQIYGQDILIPVPTNPQYQKIHQLMKNSFTFKMSSIDSKIIAKVTILGILLLLLSKKLHPKVISSFALIAASSGTCIVCGVLVLLMIKLRAQKSQIQIQNILKQVNI